VTIVIVIVIVVRRCGAVVAVSLFENWGSSVNVVTILHVYTHPLLPIEEEDFLFSQTA
jgi:hypothetical protein